jgi:RNA polymerase sigma factor (TIGR02999 family)
MRDATQLLCEHVRGNAEASSQLGELVYGKLRALAAKYLKSERAGHTLQPTALVHEAYARLIDQSRMDWKGGTHFFAMAAETMRRILVDHARAAGAQKRLRGVHRITVDEALAQTPERSLDILALDSALEKLTLESPRQSRVVELRFFGGLKMEEIAHALGVSKRTVDGDWKVARAWLLREIRREMKSS